MSYSRDFSNDLIYDANSGQYIPVPYKPTNLYGWYKYGNMLPGQDIVYTASPTPSVGDYIFDNNGIFTHYYVQHCINENTISIADCLVIFRLVTNVEGENVKPVELNFTIDGITTHNPIISTTIGKHITYEIVVEGHAVKTGMIIASESYQIVDIDINAANKSYTITWNSDEYTAEPIEDIGLAISATTKTAVNLGTDFTITEN